MTTGQIIAITEAIAAQTKQLAAIDERLDELEKTREVEREVAIRLATKRDDSLRVWTRRASVAAVLGPVLTIAAIAIGATS